MIDMVSIKQERIVSLKTEIEFKVRPHSFLVNADVILNPIKPPGNNNVILLVIYYKVEPEIIIDEVKFDVEIVLPFILEKRSNITINDMYSCITKTREMLQSIFDNIFLGDGRLIVPLVGFDVIEEKLISHLEYIQQEQ